MKPIDIGSLLQASASLEQDVFASYLDYYAIAVKAAELSDLKNLATILRASGAKIEDLGLLCGLQDSTDWQRI